MADPDKYGERITGPARTGEGWLYLAAAQDAFSRRIVGWSMADHVRAELVGEPHGDFVILRGRSCRR